MKRIFVLGFFLFSLSTVPVWAITRSEVVNFEDPNYQIQSGVTQKESTQTQQQSEQESIPQTTISETTSSSGVIELPVVFAIENQTFAKYPDIQNLIANTVNEINSRLQAAGITKEWKIDHFAPNYDRNVDTGCRAINQNALFLPSEHCNHPDNYVFISVDEVSSGNYGGISIEWHGYNGLFGSQGVSVLGHEMGHALGLPDMYHISINGTNNAVNGQSYQPFSGYIMHNLTPGTFHPWDVVMINQQNHGLPYEWGTWLQYQPQNNFLLLLDKDGYPIENASVSIYTSNPSTVFGGGIDAIAEYSGTTDSSGFFYLSGNVLGMNDFLALKAFLIKIEFQTTIDYRWLNITDINLAYLSGNTGIAVFPFNTSFSIRTDAIKSMIHEYLYNDSANIKINTMSLAKLLSPPVISSPLPVPSATPCATNPQVTLISPGMVSTLDVNWTNLTASVVYNTCNNMRNREIWKRDVTNNENFSKLCFYTGDTGDTTFNCSISNLQSGHQYEWYVKVNNESFTTQSQTFTFTVN